MKTAIFSCHSLAAVLTAGVMIGTAVAAPAKPSTATAQAGNAKEEEAEAPKQSRGFFSKLLRRSPEKEASAAERVTNETAKPSRGRSNEAADRGASRAEKLPARKVAAAQTRKGQAEKPGPADATEIDSAPKKRSVFSRMIGGLLPGKPELTVEPDPQPGRVKVHPVPATPATVPPTAAGPDQFVITKDESPFYSFGPNQATPPDEYLRTGTLVTLVNKTWGWALVKLDDGRVGTIARDAVRQATIFDLPRPAAPNPLFARSSSQRSTTPAEYLLPPAPLPELPAIETGPQPESTDPLSNALLPPFQE
jgi:hypothetical protein